MTIAKASSSLSTINTASESPVERKMNDNENLEDNSDST
jgi:hypothetical protein